MENVVITTKNHISNTPIAYHIQDFFVMLPMKTFIVRVYLFPLAFFIYYTIYVWAMS